MASGTIRRAQKPLLLRTASGSVTNLGAGQDVAVTLTVDAPSGYHVLMTGPIQTSGFVGFGVVSSETRVWIHNPGTGAASGNIYLPVLYEKD